MSIVLLEDRLNHQVVDVLNMLTSDEAIAVAHELGWSTHQLTSPLIEQIVAKERSIGVPLSNVISDAIEEATNFWWYDGNVVRGG